MSTLLEGARRLMGRRSDLADQVEGLHEATSHARGRLPADLLDPADAVVGRTRDRLHLATEHTVVALAGATGSGKSSTFNALAGLDLATVGVRRPTTSKASACVWGEEPAEEILDWLDIPERNRTMRDSALDAATRADDLSGLVLVDLPDFDSTEVSHHLEVSRLVELADVLVWVLDPQKYADAAVHRRFLAPMAAHAEVMVVALNQVDTVPSGRRDDVLGDLRRLLVADGLADVPLVAMSATEGEGLDRLRALVLARVRDKRSARRRLTIDVHASATTLDRANGQAPARAPSAQTRTELVDAVATAAGVPVVVDAVRRAAVARATSATGWPPLAWLGRGRPDPLKRLHLDLGRDGSTLVGRARTSLPRPTQVQQARVDAGVRTLAEECSSGLTPPWVAAVRRASVSRRDALGDAVDSAVGGTELGEADVPRWCRLVQAVQWVALLALLVGAVWLGGLAVAGYLQVSAPGTPSYQGLPVPTLLLLGGVLAGIVLALLSRYLVALSSRRRAKAVDRRLRAAIGEVVQELVLDPVTAEIAAYGEVSAGLRRALR